MLRKYPVQAVAENKQKPWSNGGENKDSDDGSVRPVADSKGIPLDHDSHDHAFSSIVDGPESPRLNLIDLPQPSAAGNDQLRELLPLLNLPATGPVLAPSPPPAVQNSDHNPERESKRKPAAVLSRDGYEFDETDENEQVSPHPAIPGLSP